MKTTTKISIVAGLISFGLIACSTGSATKKMTLPKKDQPIKEKMAQLDKETKALIGSASCSSDNQCHSIGFSQKPCGGFYSYRVYSDQNTNTAELVSKVNQYNALSREWNKQNKLISNCMMMLKPQVACRKLTCQVTTYRPRPL